MPRATCVLPRSLKSNNIVHNIVYTLSDRIGKVVASHAAVARSSPAEVALIYTMHVTLRGTAHMRVGGATS